MCGFAGFLNTKPEQGADNVNRLLGAMGRAIRHRGPDSADVWSDPEAGIGFAHARLAIVDLSEAGRQPMRSASGRFTIAYNGEIYNHLDLRQLLEADGQALSWRGHSDTETLLACIENWGVEQTLCRTIGMFAIALWDHKDRTLTLARDRMGEKPLYYGTQGRGGDWAFLFGSELKSLVEHPSFEDRIDRDALALFVRFGYIAAPYSIYQGIQKLRPGTFLTVTAGQSIPVIKSFWSARDTITAGVDNPLQLGDTEAVDELSGVLSDAVGRQMVSDVPLGAFLSGGIDSSVVVALMQSQASHPVRTFSIGFDDAGFDEAVYARAVAKELGTDHTELYLSPDAALDIVPKLPAMYDEPFADHSQLPTHLVSQMARRDVTVALSGDAGDELFGGYGRYMTTAALWRRMGTMPRIMRQPLRTALKSIPPDRWSSLGRVIGGDRFSGTASSTFGQLVHKGADQLGARSLAELFEGVAALWPRNALVLGGTEPDTPMTADILMIEREPIETLMAIDVQCYLTDDILVKVDRAAMAASLETRVPMLDHRVVEFAWRLPPHQKIRDGQGKWILRTLLGRYLPTALFERPKQGFNVPLQHWLRGRLKPWAEALLDENRLRNEGFFDPAPIRAAWQAHQDGRGNYQYALWNILMFQAWLEDRNQRNGRADVGGDRTTALADLAA